MSSKAHPKKKSAAGRRQIKGSQQITTFVLLIAGLTTLVIGSGLAWFFSLQIPAFSSPGDYQPEVATIILDHQGQQVGILAHEYRIPLTWQQMGDLLPQAFVAAEDGRFWHHSGLDLFSIVRAAINNLRSGRRGQGGSTITQQVTRSLMLSREKSYFRKLAEAILAYRLDHLLSKQEILTIYLNQVYLGEGAYGVEAAAQTYFGKHARNLSLGEAALLAGLPQAPSRYAPRRHIHAARARQRYVLNRMAEAGLITPAQARKAFKTPLRIRPPSPARRWNGYWIDYIRQLLERHYSRKTIYRQGLIVSTTLNQQMQQAGLSALALGAHRLIRTHKNLPLPQGALVALDNASGRLLALVGGLDFNRSPFNRATSARRQPGSAFKPLIYGVAFAQGMTPQDTIMDAPLTLQGKDGSLWQPQNYTHRYYGKTSLAEALIQSRNVVTIKLLQQIGVPPVIALARRIGIRSPLRPDLSLALGASPVTPLEMTAAYTLFANQGLWHPPFAITRVKDHQGNITLWPHPRVRRVLSAAAAHQIHLLLTRVISQGTGRAAASIAHGSGKTGTTDKNHDAWFIGYTPKLTAGVWLGHDHNRSLGPGATGGHVAAPIWAHFMKKVQP